MVQGSDEKRPSVSFLVACAVCVLLAAGLFYLGIRGRRSTGPVPSANVAALAPLQATPALRVLYDRQARQCKGVTAKGERCKRRTSDPSGYCYSHRRQVAPGGVN